eukprot:5490650-Ditylum_brightwellii.AAC.2
MEKETNEKDKYRDNTLASKYCHIHCGGYSGQSLHLGACRSSRAAVDISILQMESPDNMLDNKRSICVKQPYFDMIN